MGKQEKAGTRHADFHLRWSKHAPSGKVYSTNLGCCAVKEGGERYDAQQKGGLTKE